MSAGRRTGNKPWKHIYGVDRKYTARIDRQRARAGVIGPATSEKVRALLAEPEVAQ